MTYPANQIVSGRIIRRVLTGAAISLLAGSCQPGYMPPVVTPQLANISQAPTPQLQRGHAIHQAKCAKCHPFENPAEYSEQELAQEIIPTMARKSKLDAADSQAVLAYLLAARRLPVPQAAADAP